jgi:hypothetical protein
MIIRIPRRILSSVEIVDKGVDFGDVAKAYQIIRALPIGLLR